MKKIKANIFKSILSGLITFWQRFFTALKAAYIEETPPIFSIHATVKDIGLSAFIVFLAFFCTKFSEQLTQQIVFLVSFFLGTILIEVFYSYLGKKFKFNTDTYFTDLALISLIVSIMSLFYTLKNNEVYLYLVFNVLLLFLCAFILVRAIIKRKHTKFQVIIGGFIFYIAIAVFFAGCFKAIPENLGYSNDDMTIKSSWELIINYLYFSFANITTTGFGDIIPYNAWGKFVALVEQIIGLFIVSVILAGAVSLPNGKEEHIDKTQE